jgi:hypothetical protein
MIYVVLVTIGFVVGFAVGRWWALAVAVGAGIWVGLNSELDEVPPWFMGVTYFGLVGLGVVSGVLARRRTRAAARSARR